MKAVSPHPSTMLGSNQLVTTAPKSVVQAEMRNINLFVRCQPLLSIQYVYTYSTLVRTPTVPDVTHVHLS